MRQTNPDVVTQKRDGMTRVHVSAYAVGHFSNDLYITFIYFYLAWFLGKVGGVSSTVVAWCALSGQVADGIMTGLVGFASDKVNTRFGKRMPFYYIGFLLVTPSIFLLFFNPSFVQDVEKNADDDKSLNFRDWWFLIAHGIFEFAWAGCQISHLSIVNQLSASNRMRDRLVNLRNGFTYAANFTVLGLAFVFFRLVEDPITQFRLLSGSAVLLGTITSVYFMAVINEPKLTAEAK